MRSNKSSMVHDDNNKGAKQYSPVRPKLMKHGETGTK